MKYLLYIAVVSFMIISCDALSSPVQSNYRSHTVQKGETVFSIAKKYGTTREEIYRLNPDAKSGVQENAVLVIPSTDIINSTSGVTFKKHRVKRKETLFSISQLYGVSVEDIKRYNKHLYAKQLKKGEKLQIPQSVTTNTTTNGTTTTTSETSNTGVTSKPYTVKPKETKFGIARMYGITIAELEALNPTMGESLQIGATIQVPSEEVTGEATVDTEKYTFYEVQPKEGFYRLKVKLGLTEEQIIGLNPYAKDGLKEGMILKIPKEVVNNETISTVDLETGLTNKSEKRIAIMLPFLLNRAQGDSVNNSEILKNERTMRIALDFYSGVLMAAEFAKDQGISVVVDVFDTEASAGKVGSIISENNFDTVDAVIGPLLSNNVEKAAAALKGGDTPVFSPLSNRIIKVSTNVFQTLPSEELLEDGMIRWIKQNSEGKNIIVISDSKRSAQKQKLMTALPGAKSISPRTKGFLYVGDIDKHMARGTADNWVIVETLDPILLSNVVTILNGMPDDYRLRLFTLDKNKAYEFNDISNNNLAKLNFTFPSVSKSYDYDEKEPFLISYKNKYGVLPNRYAVRGFDVTYDVLLRLASANDVYDATSSAFETEYIENKFRYTKKLFKGYENEAIYILKYTPDLKFEVVK